MEATKLCPGCDTVKNVEEFNFRDKAKGKRQARCKICTRNQIKEHYNQNRTYYNNKSRRRTDELREEHREKILQYFSTHPCVDCGEDDPVCLDFDHVEGQKVKPISHMVGNFPWVKIEQEIAKCEVRCANCHRRRTAKQFGYWKTMRP